MYAGGSRTGALALVPSSRPSVRASADQLDPVAPRVGGEEPASTRNGVVPAHHAPGAGQAVGQALEVLFRDPQGRMGLQRRRELLGHADVELMRAAGEPRPAPGSEWFWLLELGQPEYLAVEAPGVGLTAGRRGDLDVIETQELDWTGIARHGRDDRIRRLRRRPGRYVCGVEKRQKDERRQTEELKAVQLEREASERDRARSAPDDEAAQHARRADKARYLREKLEERARSERERLD